METLHEFPLACFTRTCLCRVGGTGLCMEARVSIIRAAPGGMVDLLFAQTCTFCTCMCQAQEEPLHLTCNWSLIPDPSICMGISWTFLCIFLVLVTAQSIIQCQSAAVHWMPQSGDCIMLSLSCEPPMVPLLICLQLHFVSIRVCRRWHQAG